jgi:hypothetical protein
MGLMMKIMRSRRKASHPMVLRLLKGAASSHRVQNGLEPDLVGFGPDTITTPMQGPSRSVILALVLAGVLGAASLLPVLSLVSGY